MQHAAALSYLQEENGKKTGCIYFGGQTEDDLCERIRDALKINTSTTTLIIHSWVVSPRGLDMVFEGIRSNKTLRRLAVMMGKTNMSTSFAFACLLHNVSIEHIKLRGIMPHKVNEEEVLNFFSWRAPRYETFDVSIPMSRIPDEFFTSANCGESNLTTMTLSRCTVDCFAPPNMFFGGINFSKLQTLSLSGNSFGANLLDIARKLQGHPSIANLLMNDCHILDMDGPHLAALIVTNPALRSMSLIGNELGNKTALKFAENLRLREDFQSLNLWRNRIETKGAQALLDVLKENENISYLNLGDNCPDFELHHTLKSLSEASPRLDYANMYIDELFDVFSALKSLQPSSINLSHKALDFPYMCAVPSALFREIPFKTLMMKGCSISALECEAFAQRVLGAKTIVLQTLNLMSNNLRDEGCKFIADILAGNTTIKSLNLSNNKLGNPGLEAIGNALRTNTTLETLFLQRNAFSAFGCDRFAKSLALNTTLQVLHMEESFINMLFEEDLPFNTSNSDLRLFFQQRMLLNSSLKGLYIFPTNSIHIPSYIGQRMQSQSYHWYRRAHLEMPVVVPRPTRDACRALLTLICCLSRSQPSSSGSSLSAAASSSRGRGGKALSKASGAQAPTFASGLSTELVEMVLQHLTMLQLDTLGKTIKKSLKGKRKK